MLSSITKSSALRAMPPETVTRLQWLGLALGLDGVALVLHDRALVEAGTWAVWIANFVALFGITIGTLYQKRYCGKIDWRSGNLVQYAGACVLFGIGAFVFETREIHWSGELIFAIAWLVIVLSIAAIGLMYWLIRRSAATGFASLFYLVPAVTALMAFALFGERLDWLGIFGMVICAGGVFLDLLALEPWWSRHDPTYKELIDTTGTGDVEEGKRADSIPATSASREDRDAW